MASRSTARSWEEAQVARSKISVLSVVGRDIGSPFSCAASSQGTDAGRRHSPAPRPIPELVRVAPASGSVCARVPSSGSIVREAGGPRGPRAPLGPRPGRKVQPRMHGPYGPLGRRRSEGNRCVANRKGTPRAKNRGGATAHPLERDTRRGSLRFRPNRAELRERERWRRWRSFELGRGRPRPHCPVAAVAAGAPPASPDGDVRCSDDGSVTCASVPR